MDPVFEDLRTILKLHRAFEFPGCQLHAAEKRIFCCDCSETTCPQCFTLYHSHCSGRCAYFRRYMYHNTIHVDSLKRLGGGTSFGIRPYISNSHACCLLTPREDGPTLVSSEFKCQGHGCRNGVPEGYLFCSLQCCVGLGSESETDKENIGQPQLTQQQFHHRKSLTPLRAAFE